MKRYLIITENPQYMPNQRMEIMMRLRELGLRVINVRVATGHLEIDLMTNNIDDETTKIKNTGLSIIETIGIDQEERNVEDPMSKYIELMGQERYWEAHEVLEGIWRRNRNEGLRGLIVLAAAFAKLQEGNQDGFKRLIDQALKLIINNCPSIKQSL